ncbi:MAG: right-handed parallel beta-helix repeat-containing protein [Prolixibacteraceae bacterium]|nr:right-handed parallel beta-helix repeat-containing protein [Prolixibacteraceae bacterium]
MKKMKIAFLFLVLILSFLSCTRTDTLVVRVADYGLKPDSKENAIPAIIKAIEECRKHPGSILHFEKGRYDFRIDTTHTREYYESNTTNDGPKNLAILIENCTGLTLEGNGSDFVFHGSIQPITIDNSENIILQNINIDWDIPLTAQAKVLATSAKNMDMEIDTTQFPYEITNGKLLFKGENWSAEPSGFMEYVAEKHLIAAGTGDEGCIRGNWSKSSFEELEPGIIRLNGEFTRTPAIGNYLILRHSKRDHAGIFIQESSTVKLENINVYHCAGLGVLSQFSRNLEYRNVKFIPNADKNRYFSGHDDGFQVSNCAGKVTITDCEFGGLMDDPINVHGTSVKIMEKIGDRKLKCRFMHEQSTGMIWGHIGDTIGYLENSSMQTLGKGTLTGFEKLNRDEFFLEFSHSVPTEIVAGDALENLSWSPALTVQNCKFNSCRARGLLVSTPGKVTIDKNEFESSGSAILIAGDANGWYESGAVNDVTISNNIFKDACMTSMYQFCEGIISIYPIIPAVDSLKSYHRNITIEKNTFRRFDYPVLYALSVDGIRFNFNTIERSHDFVPFHIRKNCLTFEACLNVEVKGNVFYEEALSKDIRLEKMDSKQINADIDVFKHF